MPSDGEFCCKGWLDDTSPETRKGQCILRVNRESNSLVDAIVSIAKDVKRAGFRVVGIEEEDFVSLKTISTRLGRTYESVRKLARGTRGPGGFPAPLSPHNWALYSWPEVARWFANNYGTSLPATDDDRVISAANHLLRAYTVLGLDGMEKSLKLEKLKDSVMQAI